MTVGLFRKAPKLQLDSRETTSASYVGLIRLLKMSEEKLCGRYLQLAFDKTNPRRLSGAIWNDKERKARLYRPFSSATANFAVVQPFMASIVPEQLVANVGLGKR